MFGSLRCYLSLLLLSVAACAQNVKITFVGQACFYVQSEGGPTIAVDPPAPSIGYALPSTAADAVTVSHNHGDHNNSAGVRGAFALVDGRPTTARTEMTAAGLPFVLIPGFHDNTNGSARGPNTIMRWTQGGLRFAHFGDFGQDDLTAAQLADLRDLDVMMFPAGGFFTPDGAQMAKLIDQLKPRVAILMHYRTALAGPAQLATHPAVTQPFPQIRYKPATLSINRANLPAATEVWVMEPAADTVAVNAAGFVAGAPASPSAILSAFGAFTGSATAAAAGFPLPRKLGDTDVVIGNDALPLYSVSPGQINFVVPSSLAPGQYAFDVRVAGQRVGRGTFTSVARAPALFGAVDQDGRLARGRRGGFITIYATGQGSVAPPVADGAAASVNPLSRTTVEPAVFLGGRRASVAFSGLAPGYAGLWQINAQISQDTFAGEVDLVVLFDTNLVSNALKVTVE
jgi:uncharacterized protein (TIGR03437 family)